ncbi:hypothetical protein PIB30_079387, partial [Stylosanthes scabra]|nr:hypothetical protein [Stylosanthes scabra]
GNRDKQPIQFDPEIRRTLRKRKKKTRQQQHIRGEEEQVVFEEVQQENMAAEFNNEQRRTLGDCTILSTTSYGSSIVRPTVEANNFELKPSLIQLVQ